MARKKKTTKDSKEVITVQEWIDMTNDQIKERLQLINDEDPVVNDITNRHIDKKRSQFIQRKKENIERRNRIVELKKQLKELKQRCAKESLNSNIKNQDEDN